MIFDIRVAPLLLARYQESRTHSRFGRGRGNGTVPRSTTAFCTNFSGNLWIEPVNISLAGGCFLTLLIFRNVDRLNIRVTGAPAGPRPERNS
jgi:hypothetical protein